MKKRKQKNGKRFEKRSNFDQNRHHNVAKSKGGSSQRKNIIWLNREFHDCLHYWFGNKTLKEIIEILKRLDSSKENQPDGDLPMETYKQRFGGTNEQA